MKTDIDDDLDPSCNRQQEEREYRADCMRDEMIDRQMEEDREKNAGFTWSCSECGTINGIHRQSCRQCGLSIYKSQAAESPAERQTPGVKNMGAVTISRNGYIEDLERQLAEAKEVIKMHKESKASLPEYTSRRDLKRQLADALEKIGNLKWKIDVDRKIDAGRAMYRGGLLAQVKSLENQLATERALADRLADAVACLTAETSQGYDHIQSAFNAWKEARKP